MVITNQNTNRYFENKYYLKNILKNNIVYIKKNNKELNYYAAFYNQKNKLFQKRMQTTTVNAGFINFL